MAAIDLGTINLRGIGIGLGAIVLNRTSPVGPDYNIDYNLDFRAEEPESEDE